jgi:hypothetical protein
LLPAVELSLAAGGRFRLMPMTDYDWNQFYGDLAAAVNAQIVTTYPVPMTLIETPAQGDFLWFYENVNGLFNERTFDYISACISPSATYPALAALTPSGGFINAYVQMIAKIAYTMSAAQQSEINRVTLAAALQASTIISDYQASFGLITEANITQAQLVCGSVVQTSLDFVISYQLGAIWSGRAASREPLLMYQQMQRTASVDALLALLPAVPPNGGTVVSDVWTYLQKTASVAVLQSQAQGGSWLIAQLLSNTANPSGANGGMEMVDPLTGVPAGWQVRYSITRAISAIQADLSDPSRVLTASSILSPVPGCGCKPVNMTFQFPGYTLVPVSAAPWDMINSGWFLGSAIAVAYAAQDNNVTGYRFVADPGYNLRPFAFGGTFGTITNLLISNYPVVTMQGEQAPTRELSERLSLLSLVGLGTDDVRYSASTERNDGGMVTITYAPDALPAEAGVPLLMQRAHVIGCTVSNPAATG